MTFVGHLLHRIRHPGMQSGGPYTLSARLRALEQSEERSRPKQAREREPTRRRETTGGTGRTSRVPEPVVDLEEPDPPVEDSAAGRWLPRSS